MTPGAHLLTVLIFFPALGALALMILRAFLDPTEIVDLFFFSSGGGKT